MTRRDEDGEPRDGAARRRRRFAVGVTAATLIAAVGIGLAATVATSPAEAERERAAPDLAPPTVEVASRELREVVGGPCRPAGSERTVVAPELPPDTVAVVTAVGVAGGDELGTGTFLIEISGRPHHAVVDEVPFYRPLEAGARGEDVVRLEVLLDRAERPVVADGVLSTGEIAAFHALLASHREAHVTEADRIARELLVAVPDGARVTQVAVTVGDRVEPGQPLLSISGAADGLSCSVAGGSPLAVDDPVSLAQGDRTVAGTIAAVGATDPERGAVEIRVVPSEPLPGGAVEVELELSSSRGEVPVVPVGALFTAPDGGFEVRTVHEDGLRPVAVDVGAVANGYAEVHAAGLEVGAVVALHADEVRVGP